MSDSTPICRCRVLYLGSAVPRQSKDGLQGIQEPLRSLYPSEGALGAKGIDSWLSVWSNGILMENVDENLQNITRFFPIESLHYCAAVRRVLIPDRNKSNSDPKFLPLDSPFARMPRAQHPPIFSAILRRTSGIKVLECHAFICKREAAANALVRCCFHAYADNSYLQQLKVYGKKSSTYGSIYGTLPCDITHDIDNENTLKVSKKDHFSSNNIDNLKSLNKTNGQAKFEDVTSECDLLNVMNDNNAAEGYTSVKNFYGSSADLNIMVNDSEILSSTNNGNHKIWNGYQEDEQNSNVENNELVRTTATVNRPSRSRQISVPIDIEPPPVKEENNNSTKKSKNIGAYETQSLSETLMRPKHMHQNSFPRCNTSALYGPSMDQEMHRKFFQQSLSKRLNTTQRNLTGGWFSKEPYCQSPCYSNIHLYMPPQCPRPVYPEYATLQSSMSAKKKKNANNYLHALSLNMPPFVSNQHSLRKNVNASKMQSPNIMHSTLNNFKPTELESSLADSLDDGLNSISDSYGGTGIYRRRGHLNERAFSYSIRQEHRSRSHGSLAGLKFSSPEKNKNSKTEQDVSQMVAALQIGDDKN